MAHQKALLGLKDRVQRFFPFKSLGVTIGPYPNKSVDGYMAAAFEDVYVNGALYDNFNTAPLDSTKWSNSEIIRKIENGKLNLSRS